MVVDVITFNGEYDLLEIRLNILNDSIDQFIICEAETTFSGYSKPLYYPFQQLRYKKFWPKIKYYKIEESYTPKEIALADSSPNTKGADHWKNEFLQKESIKKALTHLHDDDSVFIGDCDEIPNMEIDYPFGKLKLDVYSYYLNNRSSEQFWGTLFCKYKDIKDECLNHLRVNALKIPSITGWHFTSMGGYEEVKRKLNNSYTDESYANAAVMNNLEKNIIHTKDFLGRDFEYTLDESHWPQWLKDNRGRYKHLCK